MWIRYSPWQAQYRSRSWDAIFTFMGWRTWKLGFGLTIHRRLYIGLDIGPLGIGIGLGPRKSKNVHPKDAA